MNRRNEPGANRADKEERWKLCLWTCQIIWKKRCNAVFKQAMPNPRAAVDEAKKLLKEYTRLPKTTVAPTRPQARIRWLKLEHGHIKINCDATWCHRTKRGGLRVIARNSDETFIGGANRRVTGQGIDELEAEVVRMGVKFAKEKGWTRMVVESDSTIVVSQIQGNTHHWRIGTICDNIRGQVKEFQQVKWKAKPRTANECANWNAIQSRMGVCLDEWVEQPPTPP